MAEPVFTIADAPDAAHDEEGKKTAQRERIIEAVEDAGLTFWRDADGDAYASRPVDGRIERYKVRSRRFGLLVRSIYGAANPATTRTDNGFRLIVAWLVAALWPEGPYPVLALDGEQGSGKSTVSRMLRRLVDPNKAEHRAPPRNEDDLLIAASNGRIVALDNVSFIEADIADALCRLATGAGFSKRRLYSDSDEVIVCIARPVLMNGIPSLLARGDLADRAIAVTLPPIPDQNRRPESEVWAEFDQAAPAILGLLLDGVVTALRQLPTLQLPRLPRMADFARLACAASPAFGWTAQDMLDALDANRADAVETVIENDAVAVAVQNLVAQSIGAFWTGTATQLLSALNEQTAFEIKNDRAWPKDGARLSTRLKRVQPALRRAGIEVTNAKEGHSRVRKIEIAGNRQTASAPSAVSASVPLPSAAATGLNGEMPVNPGFSSKADAADADSVSPGGWL